MCLQVDKYHGSADAFNAKLRLQLLLEPLSYAVDVRRLCRRAATAAAEDDSGPSAGAGGGAGGGGDRGAEEGAGGGGGAWDWSALEAWLGAGGGHGGRSTAGGAAAGAGGAAPDAKPARALCIVAGESWSWS